LHSKGGIYFGNGTSKKGIPIAPIVEKEEVGKPSSSTGGMLMKNEMQIPKTGDKKRSL